MKSYKKMPVMTSEVARKHADVGYALYVAGQSIIACQNEQQRIGWHNAYAGEMAAATAEAQAFEDARLDVEFWRKGQW